VRRLSYGNKRDKSREKGDRILLLLKIKSILSPFINGSIQFFPALLSFQRALSVPLKSVGNNIPDFVGLEWLKNKKIKLV